jgi:hypothetical protein
VKYRALSITELILIAVFRVFDAGAQSTYVTDTKATNDGSKLSTNIDIQSVGQSVNQFTGDVALTYPLFELADRHGLKVSVALSYSSNIHPVVGRDNHVAPTGWVGLGWTLDFGRIINQHNGTVSTDDDEYFIQGSLGNGRLISTGNIITLFGNPCQEYRLENSYFTRVGFASAINQWFCLLADGTIYSYQGTRNLRAWNNWIGESKYASTLSLTTGWDLKYVENIYGDKITFEYEIVSESLPDGSSFTKACYPKKIISSSGRHVVFNLDDKMSNEYIDIHSEQHPGIPEDPTLPDAYQEIFETKYLSSAEFRDEQGVLLSKAVLGYNESAFVGTGVYQKRVLTSADPEK